MPKLTTELNVEAPDDIYEMIMRMHDGLDESQSRLVNARLILLLVNQVGDRGIIEAAVAEARAGIA